MRAHRSMKRRSEDTGALVPKLARALKRWRSRDGQRWTIAMAGENEGKRWRGDRWARAQRRQDQNRRVLIASLIHRHLTSPRHIGPKFRSAELSDRPPLSQDNNVCFASLVKPRAAGHVFYYSPSLSVRFCPTTLPQNSRPLLSPSSTCLAIEQTTPLLASFISPLPTSPTAQTRTRSTAPSMQTFVPSGPNALVTPLCRIVAGQNAFPHLSVSYSDSFVACLLSLHQPRPINGIARPWRRPSYH